VTGDFPTDEGESMEEKDCCVRFVNIGNGDEVEDVDK